MNNDHKLEYTTSRRYSQEPLSSVWKQCQWWPIANKYQQSVCPLIGHDPGTVPGPLTNKRATYASFWIVSPLLQIDRSSPPWNHPPASGQLRLSMKESLLLDSQWSTKHFHLLSPRYLPFSWFDLFISIFYFCTRQCTGLPETFMNVPGGWTFCPVLPGTKCTGICTGSSYKEFFFPKKMYRAKCTGKGSYKKRPYGIFLMLLNY